MGKHKRSHFRSSSPRDKHVSRRELMKRLETLERLMSRRYSRSRSGFSDNRSRSPRSPQDTRMTTPSGSIFHGTDRGSPARSALVSPSSPSALVIHNDEELPEEILECLGEDPSKLPVTHITVLSSVVTRWTHVMFNGLPKEDKGQLLKLYQPPADGGFKPPLLNTEVEAILPTTSVKKDRYQVASQTQMLASLGAHSEALKLIASCTTELPEPFKKQLGRLLSDSANLISDLVFTTSQTRRHLLFPLLSKQVKELTLKVPPREFLFGANMADELRTAKSAERLAKDLKAPGSTSQNQHRFSKSEGGG
ncbi:hypothetical protein TcasGA2_TC032519 [Tribolium castaneum]|uniref:Uncharacterized protein n=1 Tax=Tribolium castaneum TaxID=7070 RepID=A0A139WKL4_TRICA|nr:PREDICTED: uncharacterized protein LOC103314596 isoform X1 [Tribolium castaneum]XP_015833666.1 PREDICTED: uncharacterized protein LOC103314596 isoform X1 [Tribolium castaneum]XP_015833667.1 PREDICTED: uncharacterized protein LOC103314596 isoform X1 [Tribolium castaneum]XP_015833669.1 PREDICTED: uncharacterized protein LOC103314596 isoform X1 [Tribolium castaneum]XP_015833670.1 PREDICTED: uncharacterized protein LOC103314596 isoform X1 [Tribolium castaneum]KYB28539.1 hypothetical protein Tca|eukprot:XP_008199236.2 PREDICTED: uncharacterized protein LOC103314596 isoform X1 [Tribolium castaneum]